MPAKMADLCRDWLTNQNTDCWFVVIGLVQDIPQSFALHLKMDPVGPPFLLAVAVVTEYLFTAVSSTVS